MKACSIWDCTRPISQQASCSAHSSRLHRHGSTQNPNDKRSEARFWGNVVKEGECDVWTGHLNCNGYGDPNVRGEKWLAHRYAWWSAGLDVPDGLVLDHICWNRACVNIEHLRLATVAQNNASRGVGRSDNTTGYRNVYWHKQSSKWRVAVGGAHVGLFIDKSDAIAAADAARKEMYGEFAGRG